MSNQFTRKILKEKLLKNNRKVALEKVDGCEMYSVILYENNEIIYSCCRECRGATAKECMKALHREFKRIVQDHFTDEVDGLSFFYLPVTK